MKVPASLPFAVAMAVSVGAFAPGQAAFGTSRSKMTDTSLAASTLEGRKITGALKPTNNFVLLKVAELQEATDSGILLTGSAKIQKTEGEVMAVGPGKTHQDSSKIIPIPVSEGDRVVYGQYDGTELEYGGEKHTLIRDEDILVKYSGDKLTIDNVETVNDNVLVRVELDQGETPGGLLLAKSKDDESRPSTGVVVKVGPGKMGADGKLLPMDISVGDQVKFRDFAGNEVDIGTEEFSVVKIMDILAKF